MRERTGIVIAWILAGFGLVAYLRARRPDQLRLIGQVLFSDKTGHTVQVADSAPEPAVVEEETVPLQI